MPKTLILLAFSLLTIPTLAQSTTIFPVVTDTNPTLITNYGFLETQLGIDQLAHKNFAPLVNKGRIGLIVNHTAIDYENRRTVDLLHQTPNVNLTTLFSPEHGLYGALDQSKIDNAIDPKTKLRVYSLYGATRKPTAKMLENVDTLVFEIQDIGTRFYTYIATMGHAMEAAAEHNKRFVVIDRPNPIGGLKVDGPLPDADLLAFTAYREIPIVHGMTIGELAYLFNEHFQINCDLTIVPMRNWQRHKSFGDTGLEWVNPSPNMRSPNQAELYPAIGLLEFTNLSVGRGTDTPFEHIGAPWINAAQLANALTNLNLPGITFAPTAFTPNASKYENEPCQGVSFKLTNFDKFQPTRTALALMQTLKALYPNNWDDKNSNRLLRNTTIDAAWRNSKTTAHLPALWAKSLQDFLHIRQQYLIYPK